MEPTGDYAQQISEQLDNHQNRVDLTPQESPESPSASTIREAATYVSSRLDVIPKESGENSENIGPHLITSTGAALEHAAQLESGTKYSTPEPEMTHTQVVDAVKHVRDVLGSGRDPFSATDPEEAALNRKQITVITTAAELEAQRLEIVEALADPDQINQSVDAISEYWKKATGDPNFDLDGQITHHLAVATEAAKVRENLLRKRRTAQAPATTPSEQRVELQVAIDEAKREEQVVEITDTDFFRELQAKAKAMRAERSSQEPASNSKLESGSALYEDPEVIEEAVKYLDSIRTEGKLLPTDPPEEVAKAERTG